MFPDRRRDAQVTTEKLNPAQQQPLGYLGSKQVFAFEVGPRQLAAGRRLWGFVRHDLEPIGGFSGGGAVPLLNIPAPDLAPRSAPAQSRPVKPMPAMQ